jgi:hypothetical protein
VVGHSQRYKARVPWPLMDWRKISQLYRRADEAVSASHMALADARREREGWRRGGRCGRRSRDAPAERMVTVCMYGERFRAETGEWIVTPPTLAEKLHHPEIVPVTHGVCPICLAGSLPWLNQPMSRTRSIERICRAPAIG